MDAFSHMTRPWDQPPCIVFNQYLPKKKTCHPPRNPPSALFCHSFNLKMKSSSEKTAAIAAFTLISLAIAIFYDLEWLLLPGLPLCLYLQLKLIGYSIQWYFKSDWKPFLVSGLKYRQSSCRARLTQSRLSVFPTCLKYTCGSWEKEMLYKVTQKGSTNEQQQMCVISSTVIILMELCGTSLYHTPSALSPFVPAASVTNSWKRDQAGIRSGFCITSLCHLQS